MRTIDPAYVAMVQDANGQWHLPPEEPTQIRRPETDAEFEARIARAHVTADEIEAYRQVRYGDRYVPPDVLPDLADVSTLTAPTNLDDWLIRDLLRPGKLMLIAASEGVGKSYVRKEMEIRLATGTGALFGHYTIARPVRVGTVDEENGPDEEYRRDEEILTALGLSRTDLDGRYRRASFLGLNLNDPRTQDYLRRQVDGGLDVLFLDTGGSMVDEEYGAPLRGAIRFLRTLLRQHPTLSIVLSVHMVKPSRDPKAVAQKRRPLSDVMGQWTRSPDVVAVLTDLGADRFRWELVKRRGVARSAGIVDYSSGLTTWVADVDGAEEVASTGDTIRVLRAIGAGATDWKAVVTGTEIARDRVFAAIRGLRGDGLIGSGTPYVVTADGWEAIE